MKISKIIAPDKSNILANSGEFCKKRNNHFPCAYKYFMNNIENMYPKPLTLDEESGKLCEQTPPPTQNDSQKEEAKGFNLQNLLSVFSNPAETLSSMLNTQNPLLNTLVSSLATQNTAKKSPQKADSSVSFEEM